MNLKRGILISLALYFITLVIGVIFTIVGFIIDVLFFLTQPNGAQLIGEYYKNPSFYIILALVVMTCVFIGSRENNHPSRKHIKVKVKPKSKSKKSSR